MGQPAHGRYALGHVPDGGGLPTRWRPRAPPLFTDGTASAQRRARAPCGRVLPRCRHTGGPRGTRCPQRQRRDQQRAHTGPFWPSLTVLAITSMGPFFFAIFLCRFSLPVFFAGAAPANSGSWHETALSPHLPGTIAQSRRPCQKQVLPEVDRAGSREDRHTQPVTVPWYRSRRADPVRPQGHCGKKPRALTPATSSRVRLPM
jgi:hypothetical protein